MAGLLLLVKEENQTTHNNAIKPEFTFMKKLFP